MDTCAGSGRHNVPPCRLKGSERVLLVGWTVDMVLVVPGDEGRRLGSVSSVARRAALDQAARAAARRTACRHDSPSEMRGDALVRRA
jgi:hypothetical protein